MATESSSTNGNKKVIWFWQSNPNPWNENEQKEWKRYSDFENEYIEKAYQKKENEVQLNDYVINFKHKIQLRNGDGDRQRPVKREEVDSSQYVKEERFCYPERALKSFEIKDNWDHNYVNKWTNENRKIERNFRVVAELAAQGILKEGKLLNQEFDAQRMAEQLRNAQGEEEILQCAARLYTAESFLYKLVNSTLRNNDMSKLDTLGPFCNLLWDHLLDTATHYNQILYRGGTFTNEMIEEYEQVVDQMIIWLAFTSTTKNRRLAERCGNTLFIISMTDAINFRSDMSSLSHYPGECEVLLNARYRFRIDKVERDSSGKNLIYMSALPTL